MIRENGGWDRFKMIEVEKYLCKDNREAERREDEIMKELKATMNMIRASRTNREYYENNKDKIQEYGKEYRENNKEKIQEYGKEYYENNKDMIRKRINSKVTCKCGTVIIRNSLKRHERTKKHTDLINPIN